MGVSQIIKERKEFEKYENRRLRQIIKDAIVDAFEEMSVCPKCKE